MKHTKQLFLLLLLAIVSNVAAWGETSTLTFEEACGGSGTADDRTVWTVASDAPESNFSTNNGIHYGTGSVAVSYLTLSTSGIEGTITKIVVNASGASKTTAKLNVIVDDSEFGSEKTVSNTPTDYTFEGSATGSIVVKLSQTSAKKALYIKSVTVTYSSGQTVESVAIPTFSPISGKSLIANSDKVSISTTTEGATIYYTTDGSDPTTSSNQYALPFTLSQAGTVTVKAIAVKNGMADSSIGIATYKVISDGDGDATFVFNTDAGLNELGIKKPASGSATNLTEQLQSGIVSLATTNGSTSTRVYNSGGKTDLRVYKNGSLNFSVPQGYSITKISFSGNTDFYNLSSNADWTGSESSVTLTAYGTCNINSITVEYVQKNDNQVATPTFDPVAGEVEMGTEVTFNCSTEGVTYYYTTDGTEPTTSSASGSSYTVNSSVTLKVIAVKSGMENSEVATATYTIAKNNPNLAFLETNVTANIGESFTPPTLSYAEGYDGTITYSSSNSAITVNAETGEVSFDASAAGETTTITATASETDNFSAGTTSYVLNVVNPNAIEGNLNNATFGTNYDGSITPIGDFTSVSGKIEDVTVTYAKGTSSNAYINDNEIRLYNGSSLTFEAPDGYYISSLTFDATLANCSSEEGDIKDKTLIAKDEQTTVTITKTTTGGLTLKSVTITLCPAASSIAAPTITPPTGTYTEAQTVVITNNAEGATVYYTTDGSNPTAASTAYSIPFVLSKSGTYTVKAIAILDDQSSRIVTNTITINIHVDAPVISPATGTQITEEMPITITGAEGTTIYYTTDGSDPVKDGALTGTAKAYTEAFTLTKAGTVKAVARDAGGNFSEIVSATYTYNGTVTAPYYENFDEGLGNFTVETSGTGAPEWEFRISTNEATYGTRKYAFVNGSNKQGTTRLVSPVIDLTDETIQNVTLSFVHAGRFFDGYNTSCTTEETAAGNAPTHAQVFVREENGTWQQVTIPNWFSQIKSGIQENIYERINSGEIPLDDYKGKKIQVSFLYTADESSTGTWNVLKFALTTTEAEVENYEIVEMKTDGFVTYVVQNDIDVAKTLENNTKEEGANVHVYKVTEFSKTDAVFGEFGSGDNETVIPAETPVIIKGKQGVNKLVIAKGGDIIAKPANNLLLPSYGDVAPTDEQHLLVFQKTSDWNEAEPYSNYAFFKLKTGRTIPNRKAYLNGTDFKESITTQTNPAKGVFLMEDLDMDYEIPLGVEIVNTTNRGRSTGVFDLMGRKVADKADGISADALQKGVYIVNGRKVVVK